MSLEAVRKQVGKPSGLLSAMLVVAKRPAQKRRRSSQPPSRPSRSLPFPFEPRPGYTYLYNRCFAYALQTVFTYYYGSCAIGPQLRNYFASHLLLLRLWPLNGSPFFYCLFLNVLNAWDRRGSCLNGDQAQHVLHHQFQGYFTVCNARVLFRSLDVRASFATRYMTTSACLFSSPLFFQSSHSICRFSEEANHL